MKATAIIASLFFLSVYSVPVNEKREQMEVLEIPSHVFIRKDSIQLCSETRVKECASKGQICVISSLKIAGEEVKTSQDCQNLENNAAVAVKEKTNQAVSYDPDSVEGSTPCAAVESCTATEKEKCGAEKRDCLAKASSTTCLRTVFCV